MKNNTLIIFTNEVRLNTLGLSDVCKGKFAIEINDSYKNISEVDDIDIWIVKDDSLYAKLPFKTIPHVNYNYESTYIVLHKTKQGSDLQNWRGKYIKAQIDEHSHENKKGEFYKEILPKICSGELKIDDLEDFFKTELEKALDELCDTWNTIDFTIPEKMEDLAEKAKIQLNQLV